MGTHEPRPGETLKAWRGEAGLSQKTCADAIGVRQSTWCDWERDRRKPHVEQAIEIERFTSGAVPVETWARTRDGSEAA